MALVTNVPVKEMRLNAVVTRADGSMENLGEIAYYHKSRVKRLTHTLFKKMKVI